MGTEVEVEVEVKVEVVEVGLEVEVGVRVGLARIRCEPHLVAAGLLGPPAPVWMSISGVPRLPAPASSTLRTRCIERRSKLIPS